MARESINKKLSRVRPPRVHITYDVETGEAIEKREIPFVVGVLADLSGQPASALPPLKSPQRKFVEIDRDNFNRVMAKIEPRVAVKVDNRLTNDDTKIGVELRFRSLEDFEPAAVANQIPALRKLLDARNALDNIRSSLIGNDKLESILQEVVSNTEALLRIGAESGRQASPGLPSAPEKAE
jgi:type VI secretion system protein ImpB